MAGIAHLIRIQAAPVEIYQRVATTSGIAEWFTEASSQDYHEGGILELRFGGEPVSFEIAELCEPSRIVWHCTTKENSWFDTAIAFEFERDGDGTIVRFDHIGWPEVTDRFRDCSMSWAYFLESLRLLLEEGRGHSGRGGASVREHTCRLMREWQQTHDSPARLTLIDTGRHTASGSAGPVGGVGRR